MLRTCAEGHSRREDLDERPQHMNSEPIEIVLTRLPTHAIEVSNTTPYSRFRETMQTLPPALNSTSNLQSTLAVYGSASWLA
jgi:hypothetical protein